MDAERYTPTSVIVSPESVRPMSCTPKTFALYTPALRSDSVCFHESHPYTWSGSNCKIESGTCTSRTESRHGRLHFPRKLLLSPGYTFSIMESRNNCVVIRFIAENFYSASRNGCQYMKCCGTISIYLLRMKRFILCCLLQFLDIP